MRRSFAHKKVKAPNPSDIPEVLSNLTANLPLRPITQPSSSPSLTTSSMLNNFPENTQFSLKNSSEEQTKCVINIF